MPAPRFIVNGRLSVRVRNLAEAAAVGFESDAEQPYPAIIVSQPVRYLPGFKSTVPTTEPDPLPCDDGYDDTSADIFRMVYRRLTAAGYFWEGTFAEDGEDEGRPSDGEYHIFER